MPGEFKRTRITYILLPTKPLKRLTSSSASPLQMKQDFPWQTSSIKPYVNHGSVFLTTEFWKTGSKLHDKIWCNVTINIVCLKTVCITRRKSFYWYDFMHYVSYSVQWHNMQKYEFYESKACFQFTLKPLLSTLTCQNMMDCKTVTSW